MKLNGDKNQCPSCDEYFNSTFAFDKHRVGKTGINRRCMTTDEMLDKGMEKSSTGFWVSAKRPEGLVVS